MKNRIAFITTFFIYRMAIAQVDGGVEQYLYLQNGNSPLLVPIVHIQNPKWYGEMRYNYEDPKAFSVYGGRIFSGEEKTHSYAIIPVIGIVIGKFKGYSIGLDVTFTEENIFFCSQSQYTFSSKEHYQNFLYSWSEFGYEASSRIYAGLALQHTQLFQKEAEPMSYDFGAMVGFRFGKWTIPVYGFSPFMSERYFILGLNLGFGKDNKIHIR